ncbi:MAG: hypothetical protein K0R40_2751, partial [Burkholderiales bacterium]|nr:hypothetical protein [Burkholderiales bacterium]
QAALPARWRATLAAVDGATTGDVPRQLKKLPDDATHLVLSVGGNDALGNAALLNVPVRSSAGALALLADAVHGFEASYRKCLEACLQRQLPLTVCTIYNGHFDDADYQRIAALALALFNDVILRCAVEQALPVLELRLICARPEDYANPIEPSSVGGEKIAAAIAAVVTGKAAPAGALVVGRVG